MTEYYLISIESKGDGSGNWTDYDSPNIGIYPSLEQLYLFLEKEYQDDLLNKLDEFNRSKFIEIYNAGGIIFSEFSWIKLSKIIVGRIKSLGGRYESEELKPNPKLTYVPLVHDILEIDKEAKTCIYEDVDLDGKKFRCNKKVSGLEKGYCEKHIVELENFLEEVDRRFEWVKEKITEKLKSEFVDFAESTIDKFNRDDLNKLLEYEQKIGFDYKKYKESRDKINPITDNNEFDQVKDYFMKYLTEIFTEYLIELVKSDYKFFIQYCGNLFQYVNGDIQIIYLQSNSSSKINKYYIKTIIGLKGGQVILECLEDGYNKYNFKSGKDPQNPIYQILQLQRLL